MCKNKLLCIILGLVILVVATVLLVKYTQPKESKNQTTPTSVLNESEKSSPTVSWKIYNSETAYESDSKFEIQYPSDWQETQSRGVGVLEFRQWPTDSNVCRITLGDGGRGDEGETNISTEISTKTYGDTPATKQIYKQDGQVVGEITTFSRDGIGYIFGLQAQQKEANYNKCKQDYEDILSTFRFK